MSGYPRQRRSNPEHGEQSVDPLPKCFEVGSQIRPTWLVTAWPSRSVSRSLRHVVDSATIPCPGYALSMQRQQRRRLWRCLEVISCTSASHVAPAASADRSTLHQWRHQHNTIMHGYCTVYETDNTVVTTTIRLRLDNCRSTVQPASDAIKTVARCSG